MPGRRDAQRRGQPGRLSALQQPQDRFALKAAQQDVRQQLPVQVGPAGGDQRAGMAVSEPVDGMAVPRARSMVTAVTAVPMSALLLPLRPGRRRSGVAKCREEPFVAADDVNDRVQKSRQPLLGRAVVYGAAGGEATDIPLTSLFAMKSVAGFSLLAWRATAPKQAREDMDHVARHAVEGRLRAALHARLPLGEAAEAHRIMESRSQLGRILLMP